jgi:hypothetical protein
MDETHGDGRAPPQAIDLDGSDFIVRLLLRPH